MRQTRGISCTYRSEAGAPEEVVSYRRGVALDVMRTVAARKGRVLVFPTIRGLPVRAGVFGNGVPGGLVVALTAPRPGWRRPRP